jgi:hypothetical protein
MLRIIARTLPLLPGQGDPGRHDRPGQSLLKTNSLDDQKQSAPISQHWTREFIAVRAEQMIAGITGVGLLSFLLASPEKTCPI